MTTTSIDLARLRHSMGHAVTALVDDDVQRRLTDDSWAAVVGVAPDMNMLLVGSDDPEDLRQSLELAAACLRLIRGRHRAPECTHVPGRRAAPHDLGGVD